MVKRKNVGDKKWAVALEAMALFNGEVGIYKSNYV